MIRRFIRFTFRLGLLSGIGFALFKVLQGRRSASELGSPSADWAPPPTPNPNLPKAPPEPELVEPVMFEEIIEKKAAIRAVPEPVAEADALLAPEPAPDPAPATDKVQDSGIPGLAGQPGAKKAAAKRSAAKQAAPAAPAAAGPVKKVAPKKAAAKKAAPPAPEKAATAKKAAPAKKAPKKTQ